MEGLMVGSGYGIQFPVSKKEDEYICIGKYKAHKTKLMGGKLQMRSNNNNQIHNLKSQNITKNIRDILLKLNKNEIINFSDVDKLDTYEKDQLYMIGKQLHITQLFDIPSTLKSQEDKLKDEFILLRGSLIAGNNNPDLLRKFKIVLLKMKTKIDFFTRIQRSVKYFVRNGDLKKFNKNRFSTPTIMENYYAKKEVKNIVSKLKILITTYIILIRRLGR